MRENSVRIEKRIGVSLPIQAAGPHAPASSERALTENVSPLGVRALLRRARDQNERVIVTSLASNEQAPVCAHSRGAIKTLVLSRGADVSARKCVGAQQSTPCC